MPYGNILKLPNDITTINTSNIDNESIKLYPIPAKEHLRLENSNSVLLSYEIFNLIGEKILSSNNLEAQSIEISTIELKTGFYIIKIKTTKGEHIKKIIIE